MNKDNLFVVETCKRCGDTPFYISESELEDADGWAACDRCGARREATKSFWLIDPTKHNEIVEVGKKYRIPFDYEYDDRISPFRGLIVTVMSISHYTRAGFDCFVKVDCTPEQLAERYSIAFGIETSVSEVIDWHGDANYHFETPLASGLYLEHDTFQLELIEQAKESESENG